MNSMEGHTQFPIQDTIDGEDQIDPPAAQHEDGANEEMDLHDEFRHLLTLLILAAAYNSDGTPLLRDMKYSNQVRAEETSRHKLSTVSVLRAIATIFVRNHEVLATTTTAVTNVLAMIQMDSRKWQLRETFGYTNVPYIQDPADMIPSDDCMMVKSGSALNLLQDLKEDEWWRHICVVKKVCVEVLILAHAFL
jgi:hypothetical protein